MSTAAVSCYDAGRSSVHLLSISGNQSVSRLYGSVSNLSFNPISPWSGLKRLTVNLPKNLSKRDFVKRCRGKAVNASLFGVGAPEALVVGVVALLVFGPKGLAEVARNLGKTLRAFQPTIRELQEVSREFKSTLEQEIGLEEVASTSSNTYKSVANESSKPTVDTTDDSPSTPKAYTTEEILQVTEDQLTSAVKTDKQTEKSEQLEQIQVSQAEGSGIGTASAPAEVAEGEESQLKGEKLEPHQILQKLLREQQFRGTER